MATDSKPCPNCYSHNVEENNRGLGHSFDHRAAHGVGHYAAHNPAIAAVVGVAWLVGKMMKSVSQKWKCKICGHEFS